MFRRNTIRFVTRLASAVAFSYDKEAVESYSDVLYRTTIDGRGAYLYMLIEHQSCSDQLMAFRMLGYVVNIWRRHLDEHPTSQVLPAVLPMVVHSTHTGLRWTAPTQLGDLIDLDDSACALLSRYLPKFEFLLDDVAPLDLAALRARPLTPATKLMLIMHKIGPSNPHIASDIMEVVDELRALLDGPSGAREFDILVTYLFIVSDVSVTELQPLTERLGPRAKEVVMTTAERLEARGEARGKARGRVEGRAETLVEQLTVKFGPLSSAVSERVRAADADELHVWVRRVLTAGSLAEVFA
ncbi:Rpn family recombination-promoting nuclease/putative transposase [Nocardia caishijiensis]|uniref:Rpn family recombination-promoting nuclease/putative transposase n=1 Tax=Nocardia caishijiensis TaxID=184756 RepID=UPI0013315A75|nr:Rpn family recombination-promoting nuclease/putative transposase [Nocardia caishijiensis]